MYGGLLVDVFVRVVVSFMLTWYAKVTATQFDKMALNLRSKVFFNNVNNNRLLRFYCAFHLHKRIDGSCYHLPPSPFSPAAAIALRTAPLAGGSLLGGRPHLLPRIWPLRGRRPDRQQPHSGRAYGDL